MTATETAWERLTEHVRDWRTADSVVDADERTVRNVALTGLVSRNGYRYEERALREGLSLYDGKPVFLDHAANASRPFDRSARDLVGSIVEPRFEDGRVRGDIRVLETEAGRTFLALAAGEAPSVGMSHVVLARRNADRTVVEELHDVVSVDAVAFPATTATFRESTADDGDASPADGSYEALLEAHHVLQVERNRLADECNGLRERLEELEAAEERRRLDTEIEELLTAADLPAAAITEDFREQLRCAVDTAARRELIAERSALVRRLTAPAPISHARTHESIATDAVFIAAVRRR
ncbi:MAG: hypothetical protein KY476_10655 [Planctomycetes bacterium]|nr:hypothetical protein [Planctomycetota bacterium]